MIKEEEKRDRAFPSSLSWNCCICSTSNWCHFYCVDCHSHPLCYSFVLDKRDSALTLTTRFLNHCQGEAEKRLNGAWSCISRAADLRHVVELNNSESGTCGEARQLYNLGTTWLDRVLLCGVKVISGQKMRTWGKDTRSSFFWDWCLTVWITRNRHGRKLLVLERGWQEPGSSKEEVAQETLSRSGYNLSLLF